MAEAFSAADNLQRLSVATAAPIGLGRRSRDLLCAIYPSPLHCVQLPQGLEYQSGSITEDEDRMDQAVLATEAGCVALAEARRQG